MDNYTININTNTWAIKPFSSTQPRIAASTTNEIENVPLCSVSKHYTETMTYSSNNMTSFYKDIASHTTNRSYSDGSNDKHECYSYSLSDSNKTMIIHGSDFNSEQKYSMYVQLTQTNETRKKKRKIKKNLKYRVKKQNKKKQDIDEILYQYNEYIKHRNILFSTKLSYEYDELRSNIIEHKHSIVCCINIFNKYKNKQDIQVFVMEIMIQLFSDDKYVDDDIMDTFQQWLNEMIIDLKHKNDKEKILLMNVLSSICFDYIAVNRFGDQIQNVIIQNIYNSNSNVYDAAQKLLHSFLITSPVKGKELILFNR